MLVLNVSDSLAENIYKCELCKSIHTHQEELGEHYHVQHGLRLELSVPQEDGVIDGPTDKTPNTEDVDAEKMTVLLTSSISCKEELLNRQELEEVSLKELNPSQSDLINIPKLDAPDLKGDSKGVSIIKVPLSVPVLPQTEAHTSEEERLIPPILKPRAKRAVTGISVDGQLLDDADIDDGQTLAAEDSLLQETDKKEDEKNLHAIDFNFVLQTEEIRGKTLWYGRNSFKCLHCEFKSRTKARFKTHMVDKHPDMLPFHENLHASKGGEKDNKRVMKMSQYESMYCKRPRLSHGKRKRKIEKQDIPGVYPCTQCTKVFSRLRYLRKHVEIHRTENKFICEDCGKSFKSRAYLRVHKRVHQDKVFKCNQCDFSSTINATIQAHRQIHNQGSVICDICGYAYTDKSTLNKHKRVHDLSRPYACNFPGCTWRFKTENICKAHIRAHTTEGKFRCSHCGYLFRHKHHLQRHETNKHNIQHVKTRTNQLRDAKFYENNNENCEMVPDTINVVIGGDINTEHLSLSQASLSCQQLVIATENQDNLVSYGEAGDMSALQTAYDSLIQTQELTENAENMEGKTIMVVHPEAQIVFQEN